MLFRVSWPQDGRGPVHLGGGVYGAPVLAFTYEPSGMDGDLEISITAKAEFVDGRYQVQEMNITGPITSEQVHRIAVQGLLRDAVTEQPLLPLSWPDVDKSVAAHGPTDEALKAVAAVYSVAYATGDPPTKMVANQLDLPISTAGRWVAKARAKGYLGPAEQGRATV